ncbi:hypothetical protein QBC42DRAFT_290778 [Cladorrhinum samala]|uniref:Uncharacterized protein n=1 Tax=Cladorrhinum samala TaxID=585594 RepID=A0AAV9HC28_9PEZI|nr:hypothetical protein QBC42DRAFT_290778 [Cladorrhinum samala]
MPIPECKACEALWPGLCFSCRFKKQEPPSYPSRLVNEIPPESATQPSPAARRLVGLRRDTRESSLESIRKSSSSSAESSPGLSTRAAGPPPIFVPSPTPESRSPSIAPVPDLNLLAVPPRNWTRRQRNESRLQSRSFSRASTPESDGFRHRIPTGTWQRPGYRSPTSYNLSNPPSSPRPAPLDFDLDDDDGFDFENPPPSPPSPRPTQLEFFSSPNSGPSLFAPLPPPRPSLASPSSSNPDTTPAPRRSLRLSSRTRRTS